MAETRRMVALVVVAALVGAATYETAIALRWLELGTEPGGSPTGRGYVLVAALLALVAGAALFMRLGTRRHPQADVVAALIGPAGAAFLVARFYSFDDYFAPSLRRHSDDGAVAPSLVYAFVALAVLAAALVTVRPRVGFALGAPVLLLAAPLAFVIGIGH